MNTQPADQLDHLTDSPDVVEVDLTTDDTPPTDETPSKAVDASDVEPDTSAEPDADAESAPEIPCESIDLSTRIEALLLSTDRPITEAKLSALLALPGSGTARQVRQAIDDLNEHYDSTGRSFRVERLAGGWQLLTQPQFAPLLERLHTQRQMARLSQAALETLAIVAYRQPILRAEIEAIRGVACGEVLRGLMERRLVKITGRSDELGRPMLYGTTKEFLKAFGISSLEDLPNIEGTRRPQPKPVPVAQDTVEPHAQDDEPADTPQDQSGHPVDADEQAAGAPSDPGSEDTDSPVA
jgi:segregation and condensation protein B